MKVCKFQCDVKILSGSLKIMIIACQVEPGRLPKGRAYGQEDMLGRTMKWKLSYNVWSLCVRTPSFLSHAWHIVERTPWPRRRWAFTPIRINFWPITLIIQVIQPGSLFLSKGVFNVQSLLVHCTPDKADKSKIIIDYLGWK